MKTNLPSINRRNFLAMSAALPAVLAESLASPARAAEPTANAAAPAAPKKYPIGLELYSVRGELGRDIPNTLREVAKMGYEVVEFYSPYQAWSFPRAKDIRTLLDDLGMRCYSTHTDSPAFAPGPNMAKAIELNQILGSRFLVCNTAAAKGMDGWKKLGEQLTAASEEFAKHGLFAGFHNHATEWAMLEGSQQRIMDVLAANTPKEFLLQLDVGTCVQAGADPVAWIKANPGRIKSVHLKDWGPGGQGAPDRGYRVLFGEGTCPWKEVMAAAESLGGVEYYLIEQEGSRYPEFETAKRCLDTWKTMRAKG
jgi:sugar phosphate isomerase/epimerase